MLFSRQKENKMFRLVLASFLLLLSAVDTYAASYKKDVERCAEIMDKNPAEVEIIYNFGEVKYDFSKTSKEIPLPDDATEDGGKLNGLTELSPHFGVETKPAAVPLSNNRYCIYPAKITAKIWYNPIMYIAKDLEKESCRHKITVRHEQTHLDIGHQILLMFAQALKVQIPLILERVGPQVSRQKTETMTQMGEMYNKKILELNGVFINALKQKNMELDTTENYRQEDMLCASTFEQIAQ